jgi:tRNA pseudouridine-54 N-methylase
MLSNNSVVYVSVKSIKGTIGEHKIVIQLLKQGYHLAKAIDQQCPFDLVAVSPEGKVRLIDVKTESYRKNKPTWSKKSTKINRVLKPIQKNLNVELMMVEYE